MFLRFLTDHGEKRAMEVIWGDRLKAGDFKYIVFCDSDDIGRDTPAKSHPLALAGPRISRKILSLRIERHRFWIASPAYDAERNNV